MTQTQPAPFTLNDGSTNPAIGLGAFGFTKAAGIETITTAIQSGYRLIDTAVGYGNEAEVGEALHRSGIERDLVQITTKLPGRDHGYDEARRSIEASRERIGVEQIDLHLIHWPIPRQGRYVQTWQALVDAQRDGEVRSIGVSNFTTEHLQRIIEASGVVPAVNQIEVHPHFPQQEQRRANSALGILTEAWSPLGRQQTLFAEQPVQGAAANHHVTPAQVVLRWHHQLASLPIPRSGDPGRQRTNLDIAGFTLSQSEIVAITALAQTQGRLWGGDPETTEFM